MSTLPDDRMAGSSKDTTQVAELDLKQEKKMKIEDEGGSEDDVSSYELGSDEEESDEGMDEESDTEELLPEATLGAEMIQKTTKMKVEDPKTEDSNQTTHAKNPENSWRLKAEWQLGGAAENIGIGIVGLTKWLEALESTKNEMVKGDGKVRGITKPKHNQHALRHILADLSEVDISKNLERLFQEVGERVHGKYENQEVLPIIRYVFYHANELVKWFVPTAYSRGAEASTVTVCRFALTKEDIEGYLEVKGTGLGGEGTQQNSAVRMKASAKWKSVARSHRRFDGWSGAELIAYGIAISVLPDWEAVIECFPHRSKSSVISKRDILRKTNGNFTLPAPADRPFMEKVITQLKQKACPTGKNKIIKALREARLLEEGKEKAWPGMPIDHDDDDDDEMLGTFSDDDEQPLGHVPKNIIDPVGRMRVFGSIDGLDTSNATSSKTKLEDEAIDMDFDLPQFQIKNEECTSVNPFNAFHTGVSKSEFSDEGIGMDFDGPQLATDPKEVMDENDARLSKKRKTGNEGKKHAVKGYKVGEKRKRG